MRIAERHLTEDSADMFNLLLSMWTLYFKQDKVSESAPFYHRLRRIERKVGLVDDSVVIMNFELQAERHKNLRILDEADQARTFARAIRQGIYGSRKVERPLNKKPKVGRNEPCPCGSEKKFKHCCGGNKT